MLLNTQLNGPALSLHLLSSHHTALTSFKFLSSCKFRIQLPQTLKEYTGMNSSQTAQKFSNLERVKWSLVTFLYCLFV